MTTTQAVGVALILLGVAYGIVYVGWLRRRPSETPAPAASEESAPEATEVSDAPEPAAATSEESAPEATEVSDAPEPAPVASEESAPEATEVSDAAEEPQEAEEPVDATQGVAGRYLGTTSPDGVVAKDLTRAADATLTVAYGALAWRPTKGTALRAEAGELVGLLGLEAGRAAADTPLTVRWHPPAAPGATYETRFVPATPGGRAALADALRALRPDLTAGPTTPATSATSDPVPEETA